MRYIHLLTYMATVDVQGLTLRLRVTTVSGGL